MDRRFRIVAWGAILFLVVTGLFNLFNRMGLGGFSEGFMPVLALKFTALVIMLILQHVRTTVHVPRLLGLRDPPGEGELRGIVQARSGCMATISAQLVIAMAALYLGLALRRY